MKVMVGADRSIDDATILSTDAGQADGWTDTGHASDSVFCPALHSTDNDDRLSQHCKDCVE